MHTDKKPQKHRWVYPRTDDSIDKTRANTFAYCSCCYKWKVNLRELPKFKKLSVS